MRVVLLIFLAIVSLAALACTGGETEPTSAPAASEPTHDVAATVEAGIQGTQEAQASIDATVEARVVEARVVAALTTPYPTATPYQTATPYPTATPYQTATPYPTATPWPTVPLPTLTPRPTPTPRPTLTPRPKPTPRPTLSPGERLSLAQYADRFAGGPGAIYVGDLAQLAGPAVTAEYMLGYGTHLGDDDGNVAPYAIEQHKWIFESDYYQSLLEKAKVTNPTPLTSNGEKIEIRHTCINRALLPCILIESYWAPNLEARTNDQLKLMISSFPELGIAGPDSLQLVSDGTLSMVNVSNGYIGGELPIAEVLSLWGVYPDHETAFESITMTLPSLDAVLTEATRGGVVVNHNWFAGHDQFLFSGTLLRDLADFRGLKTRSNSASLSDWLDGMGAEPQFVAFAEVYTALERGILDAGVTGPSPGYGQRWYEVTDYMTGPLTSWGGTSNLVNPDVWDEIPADLQQIFIEEGAKSELEQLRLASIQNLIGVQDNIDAGLELVEFSPELKKHSFDTAVIGSVIPGWLRRAGYPGQGAGSAALFNESVGPYVGLSIEPDGSVVKIPITEGPHAGKTMEQVLSE